MSCTPRNNQARKQALGSPSLGPRKAMHQRLILLGTKLLRFVLNIQLLTPKYAYWTASHTYWNSLRARSYVAKLLD